MLCLKVICVVVGGGTQPKQAESSKRLRVPVEVVKTVILNKSVRIWFLGEV